MRNPGRLSSPYKLGQPLGTVVRRQIWHVERLLHRGSSVTVRRVRSIADDALGPSYTTLRAIFEKCRIHRTGPWWTEVG